MRRFGRCWWLVGCVLGACSDPQPEGLVLGDPVMSRGLGACVEDGTDGRFHEGYRCVTHRAIGGVSMGGGAATRIALENPELFDVVGSLGAPYIDLEMFFLSVSDVSNGGFCDREMLLANLDRLDVKNDPLTWCGPVSLDDLALPNSECRGGEGDYNNHFRGTPAGRGGGFNREGSLQIVQDLALAYGNPAFYNPASPYLPPGVGIEHHVPLGIDISERNQRRQELCANPAVIEGVYDGRFNPDGSFPVITFCDGNGPENGVYEPGTHNFPMEVTLAVDYNRNGRRDYAEPVLAQSQELFDDVGRDGLANVDEPGYDPHTNPDPNGDDYDWLTNPTGTEGDFRPQEGEPTDDLGLDGVANTQDFGEGNGKVDFSPNIERTFSRSPRRHVEQMDERQLDRLHMWVDAGIHDFLFSAQITNRFWGSLMTRREATTLIDDWEGLAQLTQAGLTEYDPSVADLSEATLGKHAYLRYGDPSVCPGQDEVEGRGNHVGPAWEILFRIQTMFAFASARFSKGDFEGLPGALADQGSPNGTLSDFVKLEQYDSAALGREHPYVVILPPDYYAAEDKRYPVVYFLHGQGQKAVDLAASSLLFLGPQMASIDSDRMRARQADWQKMIIVFADGECPPGECHTGTFYIDFQGLDGDGPKHGEAFFELMRHVDATFRTKAPEMIPITELGAR